VLLVLLKSQQMLLFQLQLELLSEPELLLLVLTFVNTHQQTQQPH
jgi:hypothetical protein